jgi:outer membrane protein
MRIWLIIISLMIFHICEAQQLLTVEDAVNIALQNNFDILVARNDADIARVNNTAGNAGMLPTISVTGSGNYGISNLSQKQSSGLENKYPSLESVSVNAGTQLSWTLFDGGKMFITRNKLREIETLGEIQFRDRVLQTIYNVVSAYYDVVRQKQQLSSINESMNYNRERVKIAEAGFNAGSMMKTDLLQARIDLNVMTENAINQQYNIDAAKRSLNELLGRDNSIPFEVSDSIPVNYIPDRKLLLQKIDSSNTTILAYRKQSDIARLSLKEFNKSYSPELSLAGGYNISHTSNSEGSVLKSRSYGPQIGGTLAIPIFSAGENRRKIAAARIEAQSADYDFQNIRLQINTDLQNALTNFDNQKKLLEIEKDNNELTRENLEISLQRLRLGQTTSLEVHQAQENFVLSSTRLINFEYSLKITETRLKQLIATL